MWKEVVICITIIALIILGDIWMQKDTKKSIETLSNQLDNLKEDLVKEQDKIEVENNTKKKLENLDEEWQKTYKQLAYFMEHNELEKVEDNFTGIKSFVEMKEYAEAVNELDKSKFILKHIKEKYEFKLENIF